MITVFSCSAMAIKITSVNIQRLKEAVANTKLWRVHSWETEYFNNPKQVLTSSYSLEKHP